MKICEPALHRLPLAPLLGVVQHEEGPLRVIAYPPAQGLTEARVGATLAAPNAAVPDTAAGAGATASDAAGLDDSSGTSTTVSVVTAGAGVPVPATTTASVTAAGAGVPASVTISGAGIATPTTTGISVASIGVGVPASAAVGVSVVFAEVGILASATAGVSVAVAGAIIPTFAAAISAAAAGTTGSSSASSSRSITLPVGGTPAATPCPAGSAMEEEGGAGVGPCPVPGCATLPLVAVTEATFAVGSVVSPATPPLAAGRAVARPAEVDDTYSAFFCANARGRRARFASEPDADPRASGNGCLPLPLYSWDTGRGSRVSSADTQGMPRANPWGAAQELCGAESWRLLDSLSDLGGGKRTRCKDGALGRRVGSYLGKRANPEHQRCQPPIMVRPDNSGPGARWPEANRQSASSPSPPGLFSAIYSLVRFWRRWMAAHPISTGIVRCWLPFLSIFWCRLTTKKYFQSKKLGSTPKNPSHSAMNVRRPFFTRPLVREDPKFERDGGGWGKLRR
uniref:Uncharacterized protein n=1 Tax=Setaria viridis TaxID=4556 RepID=A0A4U6TE80_SETVI|nr:hypothetical protein SEVIR_8G111400v2 [Setaria viridis]